MSSDPPGVIRARLEVERAQARLKATFDEIMDYGHRLQQRLEPSNMVRDAWEGAKNKGADLAEDAVDAVRARPLAATGVVAGLALFLAREPLADLAGKLIKGKDGKREAKRPPKRSTKEKAAKSAERNQTEAMQ